MIIDGRELAREREQLLKTRVDQFIRKTGRKPTLVTIELSDDPGSRLYLKLKKAAAERVGIAMFTLEVPGTSDRKFPELPRDADGIFIQHPPGFDKKKWQELVDQIPPEKDVDCLTSTNLQLIKEGKPRFLPATVKAVGYCLAHCVKQNQKSKIKNQKENEFSVLPLFLAGKRIVILGRSPIVGLPLSYWLKNLGGNVTVLHSKTTSYELRATCQRADILISTVGKPGLVRGSMVKEGATVIDCGSPVGDVVSREVAPKASAITPVPGGVGPLTVVSLMENVIQSVHLSTWRSS